MSNEIIKRWFLSVGAVAVILLAAALISIDTMNVTVRLCETIGKFKHHGVFYECKRLD